MEEDLEFRSKLYQYSLNALREEEKKVERKSIITEHDDETNVIKLRFN